LKQKPSNETKHRWKNHLSWVLCFQRKRTKKK
jgi:hypothetical protein